MDPTGPLTCPVVYGSKTLAADSLKGYFKPVHLTSTGVSITAKFTYLAVLRNFIEVKRKSRSRVTTSPFAATAAQTSMEGIYRYAINVIDRNNSLSPISCNVGPSSIGLFFPTHLTDA